MDALDSNSGPADIAEIEQIVKEKMVRLKSEHEMCMEFVQSFLFFVAKVFDSVVYFYI